MDKKINIALIGYGKFGRIYEKELKKINTFNLIKIYRKKNYLNQKKFDYLNLKKKLDKSLNIKAAIIATDVKSHFDIAKFFILNNISVILEKPACEKIYQIRSLKKMVGKKKITVIINYSDTFSTAFNILKKFISKIGKIKKVRAFYVSTKTDYQVDRGIHPFFDWIPHPLSLAIKLKMKVPKIKKITNQLFLKGKNFYQKTYIKLKFEKSIFEIFFNNINLKKKRTVLIQGSKGKVNYDGYYNKKNFVCLNSGNKIFLSKNLTSTPINNLLKKFAQLIKTKKKFNNLNETILIHKTINNILKHDNYSNSNL